MIAFDRDLAFATCGSICALLVLDADEFILCMDFCVVWDDKRASSGICSSGLSLMQGLATVTADNVDVEPSGVKTG
jgi:hypothetical protein